MNSSFMKCAFPLLGTFCIIVLYGLHTNLTTLRAQTEQGSVSIQTAWTSISLVPQKDMWPLSAPVSIQTDAPCSLRRAVRRDPLLRSRFSFSVPVLQWKGSFSKRTWERLKNKAPPYGWKGISVNDVGLILSLLSSPRLFDRGSPRRCVSCAVVGNGGILEGSKQGRNIDSHDFVFRVNGAVIKGFEPDVGKKTSFYVFSTNTMKNALRWYKKDGFTQTPQDLDTKYIFIPTDIRDYVMIAAAVEDRRVPSGFDKGDRPWKYFNHKPADSFKILHPEFISNVTHSLLNSHRLFSPETRDVYMPSTGALMLLTALYTCDQVSAFGFITENYADFSDHYYDTVRKPLKFYANHDLQLEGRLWDELQRRRVMKLYQRNTKKAAVHREIWWK